MNSYIGLIDSAQRNFENTILNSNLSIQSYMVSEENHLSCMKNNNPYDLSKLSPKDPLSNPFAYFMLDRIPDKVADIIPLFVKTFPPTHFDIDQFSQPAYTSLSELSQRVKEWDARVQSRLQTKTSQGIIRILSNPLFKYLLPIIISFVAFSILSNFLSIPLAGTISFMFYSGLRVLFPKLKDIYMNAIRHNVLVIYSKEEDQKGKPNLAGQLQVLEKWKRQLEVLLRRFTFSLQVIQKGEELLGQNNHTHSHFQHGRINHLYWQVCELQKVENNSDIQRLFTL